MSHINCNAACMDGSRSQVHSFWLPSILISIYVKSYMNTSSGTVTRTQTYNYCTDRTHLLKSAN